MGLREDILSVLSRGDADTHEITVEIYGQNKMALAGDIENQGKVFSMLVTLKHEHRVWPNSSTNKWSITPKGRKTYGQSSDSG